MKIILTTCLMILLSSGLKAQQSTIMNTASDTKVVCKLTTPELQKRKATVIAELKSLVLSRKELANGYSYKFEATDEILDKLNLFIKTERLCCDFFTFQLTVEESNVVFDITGPEGAKEFLKEEVDL